MTVILQATGDYIKIGTVNELIGNKSWCKVECFIMNNISQNYEQS